jgi:hypothetical protein
MNITTLKSNLARLAPLLQARSPLAVLSSVKLTCDGGFLVMEASNMEQWMRIAMPYDGHPLNCCVGLKRLMQVPGEGESSITIHAGKLAIKGQGFSAVLETLPVSAFPESMSPQGNEITLDADYGDALKWVAKAAAGTSEERLFLQAVRFAKYGMIASDAKRLHQAAFPDLGGINVPATCAPMFVPLLCKEAVVTWDKLNFSVSHEGTTLCTRLMSSDSYPDKMVFSILEDSNGDAWAISPKELGRLVASLPQSSSAPWIDFTSEGGVLKISSTDEGNSVELTYSCGTGGRFRCSREYFVDAMSGFSGDQNLLVEEKISEKHMGSDMRETRGSVLRIKTPARSLTLFGMTHS